MKSAEQENCTAIVQIREIKPGDFEKKFYKIFLRSFVIYLNVNIFASVIHRGAKKSLK
jgi:hypothetical protein